MKAICSLRSRWYGEYYALPKVSILAKGGLAGWQRDENGCARRGEEAQHEGGEFEAEIRRKPCVSPTYCWQAMKNRANR